MSYRWLFILFLAFSPTPVVSYENGCNSYEEALNSLERGYGETVYSMGRMIDGQVIITTLNHDTKSWTILQGRIGGTLCVHRAGIGFITFPPGILT